VDGERFGSSAVLADLPNGKRVLVAGQKSGVVSALDPDHGGEILFIAHSLRNGVSNQHKIKTAGAFCDSHCSTIRYTENSLSKRATKGKAAFAGWREITKTSAIA
jgi:hypothetical protein